MSNNGTQSDKKIGTVRIAPNVLVTIITAAASNVSGVLRFGNSPQRRLFTRDTTDGVKVEVKDGAVSADL